MDKSEITTPTDVETPAKDIVISHKYQQSQKGSSFVKPSGGSCESVKAMMGKGQAKKPTGTLVSGMYY